MRKGLFFLAVICLFLVQPALAASDIVRTGDITIAADERVMGDVVSLRGDVVIHGEVFGDVVVLLGNITVHSGASVHGDLVCLSGTIDLRPGAKVNGDQVSLGGVGKVISLPWIRDSFSINYGRIAFNIVVRVLLIVLVGVVFPVALTRVSLQTQAQMWPTMGIGALTWLAALPLAALAALSIIGIPLSLLILLALWLAYYFGLASLSRLAGSRMLPNNHNNLSILALGAVLFSVLLAVPFLGMLIRVVVAITGVGAVVLTRFGMRNAA